MSRGLLSRPPHERAFLQSVVYAALFDYPLTLSQLHETFIAEPASRQTIRRWYETSPWLQAAVACEAGFFYPRGGGDLIATRRRREAISRELLHRLARPLWFVTHLPFVRMVALSGSLAHLNADHDADLDLFVVTKPGRVWSVTLTTIVVARLFGWRRRLCLNYVVSERAMMVEPADLFAANQILHLNPVTGRSVYLRFLDANRFVERFYPNFRPRIAPARQERRTRPLQRGVERLLDWSVAPLYERLCRLIYGRHLRRRAHTWESRDQVRMEAECLKLHTSSHRRDVMDRLERALDAAAERADRAAEPVTPAESWPVPAGR